MPFERIGIVGVGAIGTIIGTILNARGVRADLIDGYEPNVRRLKEHGSEVVGSVELKARGPAYHLDELEHSYDLIFLLVKQFENEAVLKKLLPFLHEKSVVCTLQNGVPEEYVAAVVGADRTVGGAVGFGATWLGPGVSQLASSREALDKFAFEIGTVSGEINETIREVAAILEQVGGTVISDNLMGIRWSKLLMNATFSGMSAALGCTFGEVMDDPRGFWCLAHLADETVKVARAQGIRLVEMQGEHFDALELKEGTPQECSASFPSSKRCGTGTGTRRPACCRTWSGAGPRKSTTSTAWSARRGAPSAFRRRSTTRWSSWSSARSGGRKSKPSIISRNF